MAEIILPTLIKQPDIIALQGHCESIVLSIARGEPMSYSDYFNLFSSTMETFFGKEEIENFFRCSDDSHNTFQ